jgi:hypothetical protein
MAALLSQRQTKSTKKLERTFSSGANGGLDVGCKRGRLFAYLGKKNLRTSFKNSVTFTFRTAATAKKIWKAAKNAMKVEMTPNQKLRPAIFRL